MKKTMFASLLALVALAAGAQAATYTIDASHSSVSFKVKHMMVSNVRGAFTEFEGSLEFDPEATEKTTINATIQMTSVDTNDEKRDEHLRSADFFDVASHPVMTFESTKIVHESGNEYTLHGNLTLRGVTKAVELEAEYAGMVLDPWGNTRIGFEAEGEINRKDFGVTWSKTMDGGGLVVGDDVEIELEIEAVLDK